MWTPGSIARWTGYQGSYSARGLNVLGLVERREPDAGGLGAEAQVVALEDARADGLDLLNQAVDRVMPS